MSNKSIKVNSILNIIKQICAVIFPLITYPYAARVLGKTNCGKVSFGAATIGFIALIASLGVVEYAVRECAKVRDNKALFQKLVNQIFSINIISTVFAYLVLFGLILFWPKLDGYAVLLLVQSIGILFTTLGTDWINTANEDYLYITIRYIVCHIISLILMFIIVRSREDYVQYAFVSIATNLLANISNIFYVRKKYNIIPRFTIKIDWKTHIKPIMLLFGSTIASLVYINSDVFLLGVIKDEDTVGVYNAAAKVYSVVKQVLNASLAVTIPRVANNIVKEIDNRSFLDKIRTLCVLILLPASAGLFIVSNNVILLISGEEFVEAGPVLSILAIALFFATSGCYYISVIMIPYKKEKMVLFATIVSGLVNIILNILLIPIWGSLAAAFTTVISEMIMLCFGIVCTWKIARFKSIKPYLVSLISIVLISIVSLIVNRITSVSILQLIFTVLFSVIFVAGNILLFYRHTAFSFINKLLKRKN